MTKLFGANESCNFQISSASEFVFLYNFVECKRPYYGENGKDMLSAEDACSGS